MTRRAFNCQCKNGTKLNEGEDMCKECAIKEDIAVDIFVDMPPKKEWSAKTVILTPQDQLKQIAEKMLGGGWKKGFTLGTAYQDKVALRSVGSWPTFTLADLITNPAAMKALFGEKTFWEESSDEYGDGVCYDTFVPAYIYHGLKATELHYESPEQAINYLYNEVMK